MSDYYTTEQLHEAYTIEYRAHRQTQDRFNQEVREHALTRRKLLETTEELQESRLNYVVNAAARFYKEINLEPLDTKEAYDYYKLMLSIPGVFMCVEVGKGFIVGHVTPSFLHPKVLICTEAAWYVEKEYRGTSVGLRLLKNYEAEAKQRGAKKVTMVNLKQLNMEGLDKMYTKMNYELFEQHYVKDL